MDVLRQNILFIGEKSMNAEELEWQDDGLQMWETGPWAEKKYAFLIIICNCFLWE